MALLEALTGEAGGVRGDVAAVPTPMLMSDRVQESLQSLLGSTFQIRRELHGGGMSRVFVAYEPALKREVAIKVLPPDLLSTSSVARFRQEIEVTAQLQHPHILPVVTTGGSAAVTYYVMPYIAGGSLRDRLRSGERPGFAQGVRMAQELLTAVAFAHERGIVHRDIKPGNVLLSEGHAILADFGISRALETLDGAEGEPAMSSVAAPEAYRAPERPRDAAADLYAVAVLIYEMLTGTLPDNVSESAILFALSDANRAAAPERVRAMARVLSSALARDPSRRFATAQAFRDALSAIPELSQRRPARGRIAAAALAVTAMAATALIARVASQRRAEVQASNAMSSPSPVSRVPIEGLQLASASAPSEAAAAVQAPPPVANTTPAMPAPGVFDSAMLSMTRGETGAARRQFAAVKPGTTQYPRAQLRLALMDAWYGEDSRIESATRFATHALEASASAGDGALSTRDSALAQGVVALGHRSFPEACAAFERAGRERPDYDAWMGIGECRHRDTVIVAGAAADSAPRFRSSFFHAARAFTEAARRAPAFAPVQPYTRLGSVAYTERQRVRRGWLPDGRVMLGQPVAVGDSFAFALFEPGKPRRLTTETILAHQHALSSAREMLRVALVARLESAPQDVIAREMLAELLETMGHVRESRGDGRTALGELQVARSLPVDAPTAIRLVQTHIRLLLRARDYSGAARLADSLLAEHPAPNEAQASPLIGPAMLTGRLSRATQLLELLSGTPTRQVRLPDSRAVPVPPAMLRERAAFVASAALGVCNDEVRAAPARLASMVQSLFPGGAMPRGVESGLLERPLMLAFDCVGVDGMRVLRSPMHPLARLMVATESERNARVRGLISARAAQDPSGSMALETTETALVEARLLLLAADSAGARATLTRVLDALPALPESFLNGELGAGTLPRVLALRAELAHAEGKPAMARELADAVVALWAGADPELQPVVLRMRQLGGTHP